MTKFSDLALDPRVLQAVSEAGYETPTPIQVQAIPHALEGRDVLGIAQTGTGKTAGFVLPMITHLSKGRARARMPRSLVLCPTRELAAQVAENFEKYSKHVKLTMALLIGGVSIRDQEKLIDRGVDVLIATPGRLIDHFERGTLMLNGVQIMVIDEADRMLDMGFIPDIERIFKMVPFTRQTLFFSATMAPEITRITQEFLHNPVRVEVAAQASTSETIEQLICKHTPKRRDSADSEKREVLRRLIRAEGDSLTNGIIFCNRKRDVDVLAKSLRQHGFDASPLHGDLDQSLRTKILTSFRDGELKLLIASDVAARGLDIPSVSHVFNFDVPIHSEDYVHRIGRTGRAGRLGKAITLCLPHETKYLDKIEELVKKTIPLLESPLGGGEAKPEAKAQAEAQEVPVAVEAEASAAPAPAAEPRRRSERSRRSGQRSEPRANAQAQPEAPVVVADIPEPAAPIEPPVAAQEPRRHDTPRQQHSDNRRGRGGRGQDHDVVGMGDHVPAFLMREFRIETEEDAPEAPAPKAARPEPAPAQAAVVETPAPQPVADPVVTEAAPVETAQVETAPVETAPVETAADNTPAVEAQPAAEVTAAEPAPVAEAEAEKPKKAAPRRRPRVTAAAKRAAAEQAAAEAQAEAAPATTGDAGEAPATAAGEEPAAPVKKPRAPRRRAPRKTAATTEAAPETSTEEPASEQSPAA